MSVAKAVDQVLRQDPQLYEAYMGEARLAAPVVGDTKSFV